MHSYKEFDKMSQNKSEKKCESKGLLVETAVYYHSASCYCLLACYTTGVIYNTLNLQFKHFAIYFFLVILFM